MKLQVDLRSHLLTRKRRRKGDKEAGPAVSAAIPEGGQEGGAQAGLEQIIAEGFQGQRKRFLLSKINRSKYTS